MNTREIELFSQKIKQAADKILETTGLIEILREFGEVEISGSYKYDLMWGPDIDIIVLTQETREASKEALRKLIDLRLFQKYEYGDFVTFKRDGRPESYIVNLILPYEGRKWEIEVWFFKEMPTSQMDIDSLIKNKLNRENKIKILEMKKLRDEKGLSKHNLSSTEIYREILL